MSDTPLHTTQLHRYLDGLRDGDNAACDELLRATCVQLERLARKMLRGFPNVRRHTETDDVLQNALLRLLRSLQTIHPPSMGDFYNLAAAMMRSELLDLARHYARVNRHEVAALDLADTDGAGPVAPAETEDVAELERWERFHEGWESLPPEERELVGLVFYHGWTQEQAAELFGVSVRTVQRRWQSALVKLHGMMKKC
jgi:RNA polymerase sigma-70 factor (ECF subfamily)